MEVTFLGHAGLFIRTRVGTVLCDPWFNPAYFTSWFPFPRNDVIAPKGIANPDYLYISHEHRDHLDARFLRDHVSKDAVVLLPDYPVQSLKRELIDIGFRRFRELTNGRSVVVDGLRLAIVALVAPSDGPTGDSALVVDDGDSSLFCQNDAHPTDPEQIRALGPFDAHFLQFSGGIWFPMVYRFPLGTKQLLGREKRRNQQERALRYITEVDAPYVFPCAGPACFLDDDLFNMNDFEGNPSNIFPDQWMFLEYMREAGEDRGRLLVPGSVVTLERGSCSIEHPMADHAIRRIFREKRRYLEEYRASKQSLIKSARASWPRGRVDIVTSLQGWIEPLLSFAEHTCAGVNGRVLMDCSGEEVVIDFLDRRVYPWGGEKCRYRFWVDRSLIESCILQREDDWVNSLFLSFRFEAERDGPYNEYVYNFFKCMSQERLAYAERYYAQQSSDNELLEYDGYMVQRYCPHRKADLASFGSVVDGVLTCAVHGWQFDLATGRCLTSEDCRLYTQPRHDPSES